ncbi:MAG: tyrosine-type recombinase/integrase [Mariprofundaceae bacterium]|nr:tyrosine-type recombinase/integrase [Mariprofundaceae bacterium]
MHAFCNELTHVRLLSKHTLNSYQLDLRRLSEFCAKNMQKKQETIALEHVSRQTIQDWLVDAHAQGLAAATLSRRLSAVKSLFTFAMRLKHCTDNPAAGLRAPKLAKRLPKTVPQAQTQQLLAENNRPAETRELALLALLYGSGLRVSEVVGVDITDLNLKPDEACVRVLGKGNKQRIVPLPTLAADLLQAWLVERAKMLPDHFALFLNRFGKRLNVRSVQRMLKDRALAAGVDLSITPHHLRHSFATDMLTGGANLRSIQEMLGHVSLTTTERYTHITLPQLQATYIKAHPRSTKAKVTNKT